jgi:hypothetical protein
VVIVVVTSFLDGLAGFVEMVVKRGRGAEGRVV